MSKTRLELTWYNKDMALIPTQNGKYGYTWVKPSDPRYCETHTLVYDEYVTGTQTPKSDEFEYSERADLSPQEDNLLILGESGDVLEALTRVPELAEKYVGQVKLIYIDPPFNTQKAFSCYEDNLEHSIWLTMMRDRLLHLKRLLSQYGTIWVHIDDVEAHRIRLLMDEVFGAGNFISEIAWEKTFKPRNDKKEREGFSSRHDTILVYSKSSDVEWNRLPRTAAMDSAYSNPDGDPLGEWTSAPATANKGDGAGGMCYAIQSPLTGEMLRPPKGGHWRFGQKDMLNWLSCYAPYKLVDLHDEETRAENEGVSIDRVKVGVPAIVLDCPVEEAIVHTKAVMKDGVWPRVYVTGGGGFRSKSYLATKPGKVPEDWWTYTEVGSNDEAKNEIKALFPSEVPFDTPKPEKLLERIIHIATNPSDIVLDCFGGSGTTAAVAQKMGRRWVTCELLKSIFLKFTLPRLKKVVNNEDQGGITRTKGERIAADGVLLPEDLTPDEAATFNSLLKKLIADNDELKKDKTIKLLKTMSKTKRSKETINWCGGGGFMVAHLSPSCFDYDTQYNCVLLTPDAKGELLIASIAANLGFKLLDETSVFDGRKGNSMLKVVEGVATVEIVDWLSAQLVDNESMVIAALSIMDGVREHLRKTRKGSRIYIIPDDIFTFENGGEE